MLGTLQGDERLGQGGHCNTKALWLKGLVIRDKDWFMYEMHQEIRFCVIPWTEL